MTVRVVRGAPGAPRGSVGGAGAAFFAPTARRIDREIHEARLAAKVRLEEARQEAAEILSAAQHDAEALRALARQEGHEAGKLQASALMVSIRREEAALVDSALSLVTAAARAVAERALGGALATSDALLVSWAKEAMRPLQGARRIVIRACPEVASRLEAHLRELQGTAAAVVHVVADAQMDLASLVVQTAGGMLSIDLRTQIDQLLEALSRSLRGELEARHV